MKYFKYYIWDKEQYKDKMIIPRKNAICDLNMEFLGEIIDGKNYDLITGEEITYCVHPYLGRLSFIGYQLVSPGKVKMMLEELSPIDIKAYRDEIYRIKKQVSKIRMETQEGLYNLDGVSPAEEYIKTFVKKNRRRIKFK